VTPAVDVLLAELFTTYPTGKNVCTILVGQIGEGPWIGSAKTEETADRLVAKARAAALDILQRHPEALRDLLAQGVPR
jgi:hypothetical protein